MELPRFVVLKSNKNNKYLSYIQSEGELHGFLQFSSEEIISPYAKMEVEMAMNKSGFVHLRCCSSNRYCVRKSSSENWINASADKIEEDQSKWSCTLFKPVHSYGNGNTIQFVHVQLALYACISTSGGPFTDCLYAGSARGSDESVCSFVDWESLVILPRYVAFKGSNGNYLNIVSATDAGMRFDVEDIGDARAGFEIVINNDGSIRIKSIYNSQFWCNLPFSPDNINVNADLSLAAHFWPVKIDRSVIALRSMISNKFCGSYGEQKDFQGVFATIEQSTKITVEELVISREIYNVRFRLTDARIYGQSVLVMATGDATNMTNASNANEITLSHEETKSSTWNISLSLTLGAKTTIQTGLPFIVEGTIDISTEFKGEYKWGETKSESSTLQNVYKVTVPPMSRVKVSLVATRGSCDVPFSYTQRDTLTDGRQIITTKHDGMYTGVNSYNFQYQVKQESL